MKTLKLLSNTQAKKELNNLFNTIKYNLDKERINATFENNFLYEGAFLRDWSTVKNRSIDARFENHLKYNKKGFLVISDQLSNAMLESTGSRLFLIDCLSPTIFKLITEDKAAGYENLQRYINKENDKRKFNFLVSGCKNTELRKKVSI